MSGRTVRRSAALAGAVVDLVAVRREFVCGLCGYGVVVARLPERCPMCEASDWRRRPAERWRQGALS